MDLERRLLEGVGGVSAVNEARREGTAVIE